MGEPTPERPGLIRAFAASVRRRSAKGALGSRLVTAGLTVVLATAVAVGAGALIFRERHHETMNGAAQRSRAMAGSPVGINPSVPLPSPVRPGSSHNPARAPQSHGPHASTSSGGHRTSHQSGRAGAAPNSAARPSQSIASFASQRCIRVPAGGGSGSTLQIWDCGSTSPEKWTFESNSTIRSAAGGLCMTLSGGSSGNGTAIQLAPCNGGAAQRFVLNSSYDLVNVVADKCVDVKGKQTANGTPLQLWDCAGTSNQKWRTI